MQAVFVALPEVGKQRAQEIFQRTEECFQVELVKENTGAGVEIFSEVFTYPEDRVSKEQLESIYAKCKEQENGG